MSDENTETPEDDRPETSEATTQEREAQGVDTGDAAAAPDEPTQPSEAQTPEAQTPEAQTPEAQTPEADEEAPQPDEQPPATGEDAPMPAAEEAAEEEAAEGEAVDDDEAIDDDPEDVEADPEDVEADEVADDEEAPETEDANAESAIGGSPEADEVDTEEADADEPDAGESDVDAPSSSNDSERRRRRGPNVSRELKRLVDLATKYPEIGAPLTRLASRLGYTGIRDKLLKMGLEDQTRGVEFHAVAANLARREGRFEEALEAVLSGVRSFAEQTEQDSPDVKKRLLHLIRLGFSVVMFDLDEMEDASEFIDALHETMPTFRERFEGDAFYHSLLAQVVWFKDRERSEKIWDEAAELGDAETSWNARGTWYKEAEQDLARAEGAYRQGLLALPTSTLLLHNLAQVIMDRAEADQTEPEQARNWLNEAEALLRRALRRARRHSMRRHINGNIERVKSLQRELPPKQKKPVEPPGVGDVVTGRVDNIKPYGAFVALDRIHTGLMHKSEISHEYVEDPHEYVKIGQEIEVKIISIEPRKKGSGLRIGLSRKALEEAPKGGGERKGGGKNKPRSRKRDRGGDKNRSGKKSSSRGHDDTGGEQLATLGELLMAKLEEKDSKD